MTGSTSPTMSPYLRETLDLLGSQDPIAVLTETPGWIAARMASLPVDRISRPEGPGKWSVGEVVSHLADTEVAFGWRTRIVLTEDRPTLVGFNETEWMRRFDRAHADPAQALTAFTALRRWNLTIWSAVAGADLERIGVHAERGPETFGFIRNLMAGHDLRHRRQIDRVIAAAG